MTIKILKARFFTLCEVTVSGVFQLITHFSNAAILLKTKPNPEYELQFKKSAYKLLTCIYLKLSYEKVFELIYSD